MPSSASRPDSLEVKRELPTNCLSRGTRAAKLDMVVTEDQVPDPNGILFSPDYKKLYVISTGKGPGDTGPGGKGDIYVFDVGADNKLSNKKLFTDCLVDGVKCGPDGMRCDVDGNVWVLEQCRPRRRLQRSDGVEPRRQTHRPYPPAGGRRQYLLRRTEAQPAVYGREPIALCALHGNSGRGSRLSSVQPQPVRQPRADGPCKGGGAGDPPRAARYGEGNPRDSLATPIRTDNSAWRARRRVARPPWGSGCPCRPRRTCRRPRNHRSPRRRRSRATRNSRRRRHISARRGTA